MNPQEAARILGVDTNADENQIKKAYKKKSLKYHPDKNMDKPQKQQKEYEQKFKEVAEAYNVLIQFKKNPTESVFNLPDQSNFSQHIDPFAMFDDIFGNNFDSIFKQGPFNDDTPPQFFNQSFSSSFSQGYGDGFSFSSSSYRSNMNSSKSTSVSTSTSYVNGKKVTRRVEKVNGRVVRDEIIEGSGSAKPLKNKFR